MSVESGEEGKINENRKVYSYKEAIELAGNGCYTISLMITLSLTLLAMCLDLFSFSLVVAFCSCDFDLTLGQKSFLLSIPFIGPVIMAYAWGYISDTRGRRRSLIVALQVSFVMSTLSAFSPNWIVLAVLKLIGTCFVSCAQSASYTLLGESCPERVKGFYLIIMSSTVSLGAGTYFTLGYFVAQMNFDFDLGYITFVPWRFLTLILAFPIGMCTVALYFFFESPKFLLNTNRHDDALEILRQIYKRNGGKAEDYQVEKVELAEEGNVACHDLPLLQSLRDQTLPLFKPPLLWNTLLLYFLVLVVYSTNSGLFVWLPFISKAFSTDSSETSESEEELCSLIISSMNTSNQTTCAPSLDSSLVIASISFGICVAILNMLVSKLATRKKALMITIILTNVVSSLATQLIKSNIASFFYFGILSSTICMGLISSYYVDLYPTSFRGMAGCLGVMMARLSSIVGVNVVGPFLLHNCTATFYSVAAFLLCGVLMSFLLPPDRPLKV